MTTQDNQKGLARPVESLKHIVVFSAFELQLPHQDSPRFVYPQKAPGNRVFQAVISPYRLEIIFQKITKICQKKYYSW